MRLPIMVAEVFGRPADWCVRYLRLRVFHACEHFYYRKHGFLCKRVGSKVGTDNSLAGIYRTIKKKR